MNLFKMSGVYSKGRANGLNWGSSCAKSKFNKKEVKIMDKESMAKMEKLQEETPEVLRNFLELKNAVFKDNVLTKKTKTLLAVAIAVTLRCEDCIKNHVYNALDLGITRKEIIEASSVAIIMGGGPSLSYTAKVINIMDKYTKEVF